MRSLPYCRKKTFRRAFDECDDDEALDFLEHLLMLEPLERFDTIQALKHPYFKKYPKNDVETVAKKFDDTYDESLCGASNFWVDLIRQYVEIKD